MRHYAILHDLWLEGHSIDLVVSNWCQGCVCCVRTFGCRSIFDSGQKSKNGTFFSGILFLFGIASCGHSMHWVLGFYEWSAHHFTTQLLISYWCSCVASHTVFRVEMPRTKWNMSSVNGASVCRCAQFAEQYQFTWYRINCFGCLLANYKQNNARTHAHNKCQFNTPLAISNQNCEIQTWINCECKFFFYFWNCFDSIHSEHGAH